MTRHGLLSVSDARVDGLIVGEAYHRFPGTQVTVCCLQLRNGFAVIGKSACLDPRAFDETIGRACAKADARRQIAELEAYRICDQQHPFGPGL